MDLGGRLAARGDVELFAGRFASIEKDQCRLVVLRHHGATADEATLKASGEMP
jgi:hypothetical protein